MDPYDLTLAYTRAFSSSIAALAGMLFGAIGRLEKGRETSSSPSLDAEITELRRMTTLLRASQKRRRATSCAKPSKQAFHG